MEGGISTTSIGRRKQVQRGVMGNLKERSFFYCLVFSLEEEENECVKRELIFMCEKMLFMKKNVCKQKSMEGSCE